MAAKKLDRALLERLAEFWMIEEIREQTSCYPSSSLAPVARLDGGSDQRQTLQGGRQPLQLPTKEKASTDPEQDP